MVLLVVLVVVLVLVEVEEQLVLYDKLDLTSHLQCSLSHHSLHNIANHLHLHLQSTSPPPGHSTHQPTPATTTRSPMKSRVTKTSKQCHRLYRRCPLKRTAPQQINLQGRSKTVYRL